MYLLTDYFHSFPNLQEIQLGPLGVTGMTVPGLVMGGTELDTGPVPIHHVITSAVTAAVRTVLTTNWRDVILMTVSVSYYVDRGRRCDSEGCPDIRGKGYVILMTVGVSHYVDQGRRCEGCVI